MSNNTVMIGVLVLVVSCSSQAMMRLRSYKLFSSVPKTSVQGFVRCFSDNKKSKLRPIRLHGEWQDYCRKKYGQDYIDEWEAHAEEVRGLAIRSMKKRKEQREKEAKKKPSTDEEAENIKK